MHPLHDVVAHVERIGADRYERTDTRVTDRNGSVIIYDLTNPLKPVRRMVHAGDVLQEAGDPFVKLPSILTLEADVLSPNALGAIFNAETIAAILMREPPELSESGRNISPALTNIVKHCLEKDRANRFQSARDLAYALRESASGSAVASRAEPASAPTRLRPRPLLAAALPAYTVATAGAIGAVSPDLSCRKFAPWSRKE